jgi:antitoxin component YwqK of YwqJK toxin-antitoxin module
MNLFYSRISFVSLYFLFCFCASHCKLDEQMKRPEGLPKEAKFDRKKNIFYLIKDQHEYVWYESGKLYAECELNALGIHHGECKYYFETNGKILGNGKFVNDLNDGLWYWYFPNGNIYYKQYFNHAKRRMDTWIETNKLGNEHGLYERYYETEKLEERGEYDTGYKTGKWEKYYPNGKLEYAGTYLKDKKIGFWKYYYPDGKLEAEEDFNSKAEFLSRVTYFPDGNLNCKNSKGSPLDCR